MNYNTKTLHKKLSKIRVRGLVSKLRNYVSLSTSESIYYYIFQITLLYPLINSGRVTKSCLHRLEVLQNRFIRASLFLPKTTTTTNLLHFKF